MRVCFAPHDNDELRGREAFGFTYGSDDFRPGLGRKERAQGGYLRGRRPSWQGWRLSSTIIAPKVHRSVLLLGRPNR